MPKTKEVLSYEKYFSTQNKNINRTNQCIKSWYSRHVWWEGMTVWPVCSHIVIVAYDMAYTDKVPKAKNCLIAIYAQAFL